MTPIDDIYEFIKKNATSKNIEYYLVYNNNNFNLFKVDDFINLYKRLCHNKWLIFDEK